MMEVYIYSSPDYFFDVRLSQASLQNRMTFITAKPPWSKDAYPSQSPWSKDELTVVIIKVHETQYTTWLVWSFEATGVTAQKITMFVQQQTKHNSLFQDIVKRSRQRGLQQRTVDNIRE